MKKGALLVLVGILIMVAGFVSTPQSIVEAPKMVEVIIDDTPPQFVNLYPSDGLTYGILTELAVEVSDPESVVTYVSCTVDGTLYVLAGETPPPPQTYLVTFFCYDDTGNPLDAVITFNNQVKNTGADGYAYFYDTPAGTYDYTAKYVSQTKLGTVTVSADTQVNVQFGSTLPVQIVVLQTANPNQIFSYPLSASDSPNVLGSHSFSFLARNEVGLEAAATGTYKIYTGLVGVWYINSIEITSPTQKIYSPSLTLAFKFVKTQGVDNSLITCRAAWTGPRTGTQTLAFTTAATWEATVTLTAGGKYAVTLTATDGTETISLSIFVVDVAGPEALGVNGLLMALGFFVLVMGGVVAYKERKPKGG